MATAHAKHERRVSADREARRLPGRGARNAAVALALIAAPAAAQQIPPAEMADLAMRVCIRSDPDASEGIRASGFAVRTRLGRTAVYVHEAGPTMTLTAHPGYFACDLRIPEAQPGYLGNLLAELQPAIRERFDVIDSTGDEEGMVWHGTTETDVRVTIDVAEREAGVVSITSSADAAPLTPPTQ